MFDLFGWRRFVEMKHLEENAAMKLAGMVGPRFPDLLPEIERREAMFREWWRTTPSCCSCHTPRAAAIESVATDAAKGWL